MSIQIDQQEKIENWFGNRGIELKKTKPKFKIIEKNNQRWLFIKDNCFRDYQTWEQVELYFMDTNCCETYDSWNCKGFSWATNKLESLIPDLEEGEET